MTNIATVNGHPAETGCYVDGHAGWRGIGDAVRIAVGFGMTLSEADEGALTYFDDDSRDDAEELFWRIAEQGGIADNAEAWLNEHTSDGFIWHWFDGEFFLSPWCDNDPECTDETCACQAQ